MTLHHGDCLDVMAGMDLIDLLTEAMRPVKHRHPMHFPDGEENGFIEVVEIPTPDEVATALIRLAKAPP